jgi:6-phosphogluconate dehydrogenase
MVKAGPAVDELIKTLVPLLAKGDVIIDGGNTLYADTERRTREVEAAGLLYIGTGVSGGEEGALKGPSIMPGGSVAAWPIVGPLLTAISAKAPDGTPCCSWIGSDGAGHFVKMVHNGIEYGDMQVICESYHLFRELLGLDAPGIGEIFADWNKGELESYLVEITADILRFLEPDGTPLVDHILDAAGQKGTGKWTSFAAMDEGIPLTLITEAVYARSLSALKEERVAASAVLAGPSAAKKADVAGLVSDLKDALFASKIVSYAQGFQLLRSASVSYGWGLDFGSIAALWRGGCIIRSVFLNRITEAYRTDPTLANLMLAPYFTERLAAAQAGWRRVVAAAVEAGIPVPAFSSALAYYDGYRTASLPANLLQGQRDYFGAHTYERTDGPRGEFHHTDWTGHGGNTAASTYSV